MIDQDKMRALATRLREDYDFSLSITSTRYRDAVSRTPIEAADAIDLLLAELEAAAADKRDAERYRYLRNRMRFTDQLPVATMMLSAPLLAPLHNFHTDWVGDRFDVSVDKTVDAARTGEHRD